MKGRSGGFTLIELLVVISIIALLSSVVLASLNAAREKGRIAAGRQFGAQVDRVAGELAVGIWDFDECSGTSAGDRSGFGNNATLTGSPTWSSDTPSGTGCSLTFNGSSQYGTIPASSSLDMGASSFTVSAWVKKGSGTGMIFEHSVWPAGDTYQLEQTGSGQLRLNFPNMHGSVGPLDAGVGINDGRWHHLVGTFDKDRQLASVYFDGASYGSKTVAVTTGTGSSASYIASRAGASLMWAGQLDSLRVFGKALTASEVGALYAAELSEAKGLAGR